ncbi:aspartyl protease family protein 1-like isoform X2 [Actinidia eriantha]|uniref:aspartyl protease family protein 1-like isoform X2 n=1 Tax=Actinidia eriantha TaxID=165200 RepID=UPI002582566C|nr:aspartyl protease family protein 1-like isoform X2 [Actinidia eriantha]
MESSFNCASILGLMTVLVIICKSSQICEGFGTFGFDIHHRYSDPVKAILDLHGLPEKGSVEYYAAMAHRDRFHRGRNLAGADEPPLTFIAGNDTYRIRSLGYLHYANVSVGSPGQWFLVALDTGSDLFWLPCDCIMCSMPGMVTISGQELNPYSLNKSSTSAKVPCNSTFCGRPSPSQCLSTHNACPYKVRYLSNDTSSSGVLVEDVLHLTTDDSQLKEVDARITFGCGMVQTGIFLEGLAPNGLFGLGMGNISVPSVLANKGLAANSFSMCFGPDGVGRISFGDKGSTEQDETPFNLEQSYPTYNVSMTQVSVGENVTDLSFSAIFDSGTVFTHLNDPAYTAISESCTPLQFNSQVQEKRQRNDSGIPFEYCYDLSANQSRFEVPNVNLTMKGGKQFHVTHPFVIVYIKDAHGERTIRTMYCLAIVKSGYVNIIGQNFMTGYRIVFDREKMTLGWEASNCYDAKNYSTLPINPPTSSAVPPTSAVEPETRSVGSNGSPALSPPPLPGSDSPDLNSFARTLITVFLSLFILCFAVPSS